MSEGLINKLGIVLGSGLGDVASVVEPAQTVSYQDLPTMTHTSIAGHAGVMIQGRIGTLEAVVMQGRIHGYEGHAPDQVVKPIELLSDLGCTHVLLTNAAGGMDPEMSIGDLMIITDQLHRNRLTPTWPIFSDDIYRDAIYDLDEINLLSKLADQANIPICNGVYVGVDGPNYETPAEYAYYHAIGADAVGMSTTLEAMKAKQLGLKVMSISIITDLGVPGKIHEIDHDFVQQMANRAVPQLKSLIISLASALTEAYKDLPLGTE